MKLFNKGKSTIVHAEGQIEPQKIGVIQSEELGKKLLSLFKGTLVDVDNLTADDLGGTGAPSALDAALKAQADKYESQLKTLHETISSLTDQLQTQRELLEGLTAPKENKPAEEAPKADKK